MRLRKSNIEKGEFIFMAHFHTGAGGGRWVRRINGKEPMTTYELEIRDGSPVLPSNSVLGIGGTLYDRKTVLS